MLHHLKTFRSSILQVLCKKVALKKFTELTTGVSFKQSNNSTAGKFMQVFLYKFCEYFQDKVFTELF